MSLELTLVVVTIGLALALLSVRTLIGKSGAERIEYAALLATAAVFGLFVGRSLHEAFSTEPGKPWVTWPLGMLGGLALVEFGKPILAGAKVVIRVFAKLLGKLLARRLGGGK